MSGQETSTAVQKSLRVLSAIAKFRTGASLTELTTLLGYPTSTVHRLLRELTTAGFVVQDPHTRLHWIGPEITSIAANRPQDDLLRAVARAPLMALAHQTGETAYISTRHGYQLLYVDCALSSKRLRTWGEAGSIGPLHATSQGKAILSQLSDEELIRTVSTLPLEAFTPNSVTNSEELIAEIRGAAANGYATNNQEHDIGTTSVAVPIDLGGHGAQPNCAALSVAAPTIRLSLEELIEFHLDALRQTKGDIERRMRALQS